MKPLLLVFQLNGKCTRVGAQRKETQGLVKSVVAEPVIVVAREQPEKKEGE